MKKWYQKRMCVVVCVCVFLKLDCRCSVRQFNAKRDPIWSLIHAANPFVQVRHMACDCKHVPFKSTTLFGAGDPWYRSVLGPPQLPNHTRDCTQATISNTLQRAMLESPYCTSRSSSTSCSNKANFATWDIQYSNIRYKKIQITLC